MNATSWLIDILKRMTLLGVALYFIIRLAQLAVGIDALPGYSERQFGVEATAVAIMLVLGNKLLNYGVQMERELERRDLDGDGIVDVDPDDQGVDTPSAHGNHPNPREASGLGRTCPACGVSLFDDKPACPWCGHTLA